MLPPLTELLDGSVLPLRTAREAPPRKAPPGTEPPRPARPQPLHAGRCDCGARNRSQVLPDQDAMRPSPPYDACIRRRTGVRHSPVCIL